MHNNKDKIEMIKIATTKLIPLNINNRHKCIFDKDQRTENMCRGTIPNFEG